VPEVTYCGETFILPEGEPTLELMEYARVVVEYDTNSLRGMAALLDLLEVCIGPDNWERFTTLTREKHVGSDALFEVVRDVYAAHAERPTSRPSASSDGPPPTPVRSADDSSLRVIGRLEGQGRPDLALQVQKAQEFLAG
jgi:hypothetical protein